MTILWMDGFDLYNGGGDISLNYTSTGSFGIGTTAGRFGGGCYTGAGNGNGGGIWRQLGASYTELWIGVAVNIPPLTPAYQTLFAWGCGSSNNAGTEFQLSFDTATGTMQFKCGSGRLLASFNVAITAGWHWFDIRTKYSATVGELEMWIDDTQVLISTGLNTQDNSGLAGFTLVALNGTSNNAYTNVSYDDFFIYTPGTRLGDSRIETIVPASDASPNNGTPSTGTSHFGVVDEPRNNTTDYITLPDTSGDKEVFTVGSLSSTPVSVWAVKVEALAEKSDAGSYQLAPLVISGSTENDGTSQQLTTTYGMQQSIFATDPATSAAWTYSAVNAMKIGVKVPG